MKSNIIKECIKLMIIIIKMPKIGNNSKCPCNSNKKYKHCCSLIDNKKTCAKCDSTVKYDKCLICEDLNKFKLKFVNCLSQNEQDILVTDMSLKYGKKWGYLFTKVLNDLGCNDTNCFDCNLTFDTHNQKYTDFKGKFYCVQCSQKYDDIEICDYDKSTSGKRGKIHYFTQ